jgi:putative PIN family toxin of toxin-antitoxin system
MLALRLVVDTNILISAALKPDGLQRTVILLATTRPAKLYISAAILSEYRDVLSRPEFGIRKGLQQQLLTLIKNRARLVPRSRPLQVASDPDDNIFLECADAARADYLITGNQKHFPRFWKRTKIITSREFISLVAPHLI